MINSPAGIVRKLKRFWLLILTFFILSIWLLNTIRESDEGDLDGEWYIRRGGKYYLKEEVVNTNLFSPQPNEGRAGTGVTIPSHLSAKMNALYYINGFNLMASDRIPLNRSLPDVRFKKCRSQKIDIVGLPKTSVIIVFHNEAWSTLLRTVWSVINRSPSSLLEEILLVDDASTRSFLGAPLDDYVDNLPIPTKVLRTIDRVGITRARILGARNATGEILTFLDAHCECTKGWLEPLIERVAKNKTKIASPLIDIISFDSFAYIESDGRHLGAFNWYLQFSWLPRPINDLLRTDHSLPFSTPVISGGLFAINKNYFFGIGSYDEHMRIWGSENIELSLRVWMCGGRVEIVPCSRVGHVFRTYSPYEYSEDFLYIVTGNAARVAIVWLDEWKKLFFSSTIPGIIKTVDMETLKSRIQLRKDLKCNNFKWFLKNIWPQHFFPTEERFFGMVRNVWNNKCLETPANVTMETMRPAKLQPCTRTPKQIFVMGDTVKTKGPIRTNHGICLGVPYDDKLPGFVVKFMVCTGGKNENWIYNEKDKTLKNVARQLCLKLPPDESIKTELIVHKCGDLLSQKWELDTVPW